MEVGCVPFTIPSINEEFTDMDGRMVTRGLRKRVPSCDEQVRKSDQSDESFSSAYGLDTNYDDGKVLEDVDKGEEGEYVKSERPESTREEEKAFRKTKKDISALHSTRFVCSSCGITSTPQVRYLRHLAICNRCYMRARRGVLLAGAARTLQQGCKNPSELFAPKKQVCSNARKTTDFHHTEKRRCSISKENLDLKSRNSRGSRFSKSNNSNNPLGYSSIDHNSDTHLSLNGCLKKDTFGYSSSQLPRERVQKYSSPDLCGMITEGIMTAGDLNHHMDDQPERYYSNEDMIRHVFYDENNEDAISDKRHLPQWQYCVQSCWDEDENSRKNIEQERWSLLQKTAPGVLPLDVIKDVFENISNSGDINSAKEVVSQPSASNCTTTADSAANDPIKSNNSTYGCTEEFGNLISARDIGYDVASSYTSASTTTSTGDHAEQTSGCNTFKGSMVNYISNKNVEANHREFQFMACTLSWLVHSQMHLAECLKTTRAELVQLRKDNNSMAEKLHSKPESSATAESSSLYSPLLLTELNSALMTCKPPSDSFQSYGSMMNNKTGYHDQCGNKTITSRKTMTTNSSNNSAGIMNKHNFVFHFINNDEESRDTLMVSSGGEEEEDGTLMLTHTISKIVKNQHYGGLSYIATDKFPPQYRLWSSVCFSEATGSVTVDLTDMLTLLEDKSTIPDATGLEIPKPPDSEEMTMDSTTSVVDQSIINRASSFGESGFEPSCLTNITSHDEEDVLDETSCKTEEKPAKEEATRRSITLFYKSISVKDFGKSKARRCGWRYYMSFLEALEKFCG